MSQLDQAKKEAKRLFSLTESANNLLNIPNLSKAKEVISVINGYKSWHEYETILRKKDVFSGSSDKAKLNEEKREIFNNQSYYIQDISFNKILSNNINKNPLLVTGKEHIPIVLGGAKEKGLFEYKEKKWMLDQYPVTLTASTGAGRFEVLFTMGSQFIKNKEGLIYLNFDGDVHSYVKFYSSVAEQDRLSDLYLINFIYNTNHHEESGSHTIDPINPMLGNDNYFSIMFGKMGKVIHAILKEIHQNNQIMDIQSLESILMLNNLINWNRQEKFKAVEIKQYLEELGIDVNNNDELMDIALLAHAENANKAQEFLTIVKEYSHIFTIDCSISMESIFLGRKILIALFPMFDKSNSHIKILADIITHQVKYIDEKYQEYKIHFQNIIFDNYAPTMLEGINFTNNHNNYIFTFNGWRGSTFDYLSLCAQTKILMRSSDIEMDINNNMKLEIVDNLVDFPKFKNSRGQTFMEKFKYAVTDFSEGQCYVLAKNKKVKDSNIINSEKKYYIQYLVLEYKEVKYQKRVNLFKHPRALIQIVET